MAVLCFSVNISSTPQAPQAGTAIVPSLNHGREPSEPPRFVREFSSAQDVKRDHPLLDRTLDIVAGPKTGDTFIDALQAPYAVTTDSAHRVLVTDLLAKKVHIFDFGHSKYSRLKDGVDLRRPVGVAADREGNVYVADSGLGAVLVYDSSGKFRHFLKPSKGKESYFEGPSGLAIDRTTEHIYVCDSPRHMIIVLDKNGRVLNRFGKRGGGTGEGEFRFPTQLVAIGGEIVVLDSGNSRLQVLDVSGRFRREIHLFGSDSRSGLAMDEDGTIYVSDAVVNQVFVFNHDGRLLYTFGQMGEKAGEFDGASGLWVDSGHCLYVVDAHNKRVQAFQIHGTSTNDCQ
ncbi:MAG: 6-bladed beta-propeller [Terriglobales bacterium]